MKKAFSTPTSRKYPLEIFVLPFTFISTINQQLIFMLLEIEGQGPYLPHWYTIFPNYWKVSFPPTVGTNQILRMFMSLYTLFWSGVFAHPFRQCHTALDMLLCKVSWYMAKFSYLVLFFLKYLPILDSLHFHINYRSRL